jgi:predicted Zn-dependent protease
LKAFQEIVEKEPRSTDARLNEIVKTVTDRIAKAADAMDRTGFQWEVRLIDKEEPNAVCLPGGKILIHKGMLNLAKNEAGLAAIIGHEAAHVVARHGAERLSQKMAIRGALALGQEALTAADGTLSQTARLALSALGLGGTVGVILPYSRVHEFEADRIGQIYMAKAGYDPEESVRLWDRLSNIKKPPIPIWLSTHPADKDRVAKLKEHLGDARKYYADAPQRFGVGNLI